MLLTSIENWCHFRSDPVIQGTLDRHVMFCFYQLNCLVITEIDIKYCCNTVRVVNVHRELVLENATSGSLKVLEKSLNFDTKI